MLNISAILVDGKWIFSAHNRPFEDARPGDDSDSDSDGSIDYPSSSKSDQESIYASDDDD